MASPFKILQCALFIKFWAKEYIEVSKELFDRFQLRMYFIKTLTLGMSIFKNLRKLDAQNLT